MTQLTIRRKEDGKVFTDSYLDLRQLWEEHYPDTFEDEHYAEGFAVQFRAGEIMLVGWVSDGTPAEPIILKPALYEVLPSQEENERLRGALQFYADEAAWEDMGRRGIIGGSTEFVIYESFDGGSIARAALEEAKQ